MSTHRFCAEFTLMIIASWSPLSGVFCLTESSGLMGHYYISRLCWSGHLVWSTFSFSWQVVEIVARWSCRSPSSPLLSCVTTTTSHQGSGSLIRLAERMVWLDLSVSIEAWCFFLPHCSWGRFEKQRLCFYRCFLLRQCSPSARGSERCSLGSCRPMLGF